MPELRRDPIVGRWVVMDTDHPKGPGDFSKEDNTPRRQAICPFCPGREYFTPPETDALRPQHGGPNTAGWMVRTVPNKFPALTDTGVVGKEAQGIFDVMSGVGANEVIIETPDHDKGLADFSAQEMSFVIGQYQSRLRALAKDPRHKYVCIFKNFGASAGATVEHAHSQVIALPMVPKSVLEEINGAEGYYDRRGRCVFCDIIRQEYEDKERIVGENNAFLAFCPYAPRYAFETWIIPKSHGADFANMDAVTAEALAVHILDVLQRIRKTLSNPSYNFYLHTSPVHYARPDCYHWHIEIIPKLTRSIGFEWGTGLHIVSTTPHDAARELRGHPP